MTKWKPVGDKPASPEVQAALDDLNRAGLGEDEKVMNALKRFQEMRESGEFCCLEIVSDYDYVWGVRYSLDRDGKHKIRTVGHFNSPTLDEAIDEAYAAWKSGELEASLFQVPEARE